MWKPCGSLFSHVQVFCDYALDSCEKCCSLLSVLYHVHHQSSYSYCCCTFHLSLIQVILLPLYVLHINQLFLKLLSTSHRFVLQFLVVTILLAIFDEKLMQFYSADFCSCRKTILTIMMLFSPQQKSAKHYLHVVIMLSITVTWLSQWNNTEYEYRKMFSDQRLNSWLTDWMIHLCLMLAVPRIPETLNLLNLDFLPAVMSRDEYHVSMMLNSVIHLAVDVDFAGICVMFYSGFEVTVVTRTFLTHIHIPPNYCLDLKNSYATASSVSIPFILSTVKLFYYNEQLEGMLYWLFNLILRRTPVASNTSQVSKRSKKK